MRKALAWAVAGTTIAAGLLSMAATANAAVVAHAKTPTKFLVHTAAPAVRLSSQRVAALIAGLSKEQAAVLELRVIAGLDTDVTARMLGKSQDAVRACLHRGLRRLSADPRVQALARTDSDRGTGRASGEWQLAPGECCS